MMRDDGPWDAGVCYCLLTTQFVEDEGVDEQKACWMESRGLR